MTIVSAVSQDLAFLTLLAQIGIVVGVLYLLFFRKKYPRVLEYFSNNALLFSFIVALVATCGSLFFSNVAGYTPCELCWFQRIFMYPGLILFGIALYKKDSNIVDYMLSLTVIGALISLYQLYAMYVASFAVSCGLTACTQIHVIAFGYITIPAMAFTAFLTNIVFLSLLKIHPGK
jgi:disulfide bond formation protein DsbB